MSDEPNGPRQGCFNAALIRLLRLDTRKTKVVVPRIFVGLAVEVTSNALDMSAGTVDNEWRFARAWMRRQTRQDRSHPS